MALLVAGLVAAAWLKRPHRILAAATVLARRRTDRARHRHQPGHRRYGAAEARRDLRLRRRADLAAGAARGMAALARARSGDLARRRRRGIRRDQSHRRRRAAVVALVRAVRPPTHRQPALPRGRGRRRPRPGRRDAADAAPPRHPGPPVGANRPRPRSPQWRITRARLAPAARPPSRPSGIADSPRPGSRRPTAVRPTRARSRRRGRDSAQDAAARTRRLKDRRPRQQQAKDKRPRTAAKTHRPSDAAANDTVAKTPRPRTAATTGVTAGTPDRRQRRQTGAPARRQRAWRASGGGSSAGYLAAGAIGAVAGAASGAHVRGGSGATRPVEATQLGAAARATSVPGGSRSAAPSRPASPTRHINRRGSGSPRSTCCPALAGTTWPSCSAAGRGQPRRSPLGQPLGDSDDAVVAGLGPSALTVTVGFGPSLFGRAGMPHRAGRRR